MTKYNPRHLINSQRMESKSVDPVTIITTINYEEVINLDTREFESSTITITNLGATPLEYKVDVSNEYETGNYVTIWSNILNGGDSDECILVRHAKLSMSVKGDIPESCKIDIISGR